MKIYMAEGIFDDGTLSNLPPTPQTPVSDTLIGVCNPFSVAHEFLIHAYDMTGKGLAGSPMSYTLQPLHGVATTFIPGNVFSTPPGNFNGTIAVEFPDGVELPVASCLGGGGAGPQNWNIWSPNVDILGSTYPRFGTGTRFIIPYLIPFFNSQYHSGANQYCVGLKITNNDVVNPVTLKMTFTADDVYANAGTQVSTQITISPGCTVSELLTQWLPEILTMNLYPPDLQPANGQYEGVEGWLEINPVQTNPNIRATANLSIYALNSNITFSQFGFGCSPFIVA